MEANDSASSLTRTLRLHGLALLCNLVGLLVLQFVPVQRLSSLWLFAVATLLAVPFWQQMIEPRLIVRGALIDTHFNASGVVPRWFRSGSVLKAFHFVLAFFLALALLVVAGLLSAREWLLVLGMPVLLLLLALLTDRFCAAQTKGAYRWVFQRALIKWPALLMLILVSGIAYFGAEHEDLRAIDLQQRMAAEFLQGVESYQVPALGALHGTVKALDLAVQFAAQRYIPEVESWYHKLLLWSWLALRSGAALWLLLEFQLGCMALATRLQGRGVSLPGSTPFVRTFIATWIALFLLVAFLNSMKLREAGQALLVAKTQALRCDELWAQTAEFMAAQQAQLTQQQTSEITRLQQEAPARIEAIFAQAEAGVDAFLDWRYSVQGEYVLLLNSTRRLFDAEPEDLFAELVQAPIESALANYSSEEDNRLLVGLQQNAQSAALGSLRQQLSDSACMAAPQAFSLPSADATVLVGQPQAAVLGLKLGALALKKGAVKVGAKATAKLATKVGAIGTGALAASAFCGPAAPFCAIGLGVGSWLLTDKLIVEADEYFNRDEEKTEMMAALEEQKQILTTAFIQARSLAVSEQYGRLAESFRVPEDGGVKEGR